MKDTDMRLVPYEVKGLLDEEEREGIIQLEEETIPEGVKLINAPLAWEKGYMGNGVQIAVLDTGCDVNHPDLRDNIINVMNFTKEDGGNASIVTDYNGHGTHVVGTICANGKLKGVAPNAKIHVLKVLDGKGNGQVTALVNAINYAVSLGVDVISMSLGCAVSISTLRSAINRAIDRNIVVICASGNNGDGNADTVELAYPAGYNNVVSVGAINNKKMSADFSNSNDELDLVAPGVDVLSTCTKGDYIMMDGTSMATPHITGVMALLIEWGKEEFGRKLSETELYAQLIKNTMDLDIEKTLVGNGMVYINRM